MREAPHLPHQPAKHPARIVAIHQAGPDDIRLHGLGEALDLQLRFAIERTASGKRAQGGNEYHGLHAGLAGGLQKLLRAGHIDCGDVLPAPGTEIIGAMHQRPRAFEQAGINLLAQPKSDRTASPRGLPRPGDDPPAVAFQVAPQPAAHKTVGARQDAES